jgi:hypothetical protein
MVAHIYNSSTLESEKRGSRVQGQLSKSYTARACLKKKKKKERKKKSTESLQAPAFCSST